jgi:glycosyltransferase involved in cell wall biosynthesis
MIHTIAYITPSVELLGARISLVELLRHLDRTRFRPLVIGHRHGPLMDKLKEIDVDTHIVHFGNWRKPKHWMLIPFAIREMVALGKRYQTRLWHSNEFWSFPYARLAANRLKTPAFSHFRCSRTPQQIPPRKIKNYLLPKADMLIAVSEAQKRLFKEFPELSNRIIVIHNGVDLQQFENADGLRFRHELGIDASCLVLGFVGPVSPHKGVEEFIRAADIISRDITNVRFLIVGPDRPHAFAREMRCLVDDLKLQNHVIFTGFRTDIPEVMSGLDFLLTPSRVEAFGRVILEAMAAGTPVIASQVGGIPEIIDNPAVGVLVPPESIEKMAAAVLTLHSDTERKQRLIQNAREHVRNNFSIAHHTRRIEEVYDRFLV